MPKNLENLNDEDEISPNRSGVSTPSLVFQKLKMSNTDFWQDKDEIKQEEPKVINFSETQAMKRNFGKTLDNKQLIEFLRKSPLNTPDKIKIRKHVTPERVIKKFDIEDVESSCDDFDLPHFRKPSLTYRHSSLGNPFMEKKLEQSGGEQNQRPTAKFLKTEVNQPVSPE